MKKNPITIIQDMDQAIGVMRGVGKWLSDSGKKPSKWWKLENLNSTFLLRHAKEDEFYVGFVGGVPVVAAVLLLLENNQDWKSIDHNHLQAALYIHWLCVNRQFSGRNLPKVMVDFAARLAKKNGAGLLRLDASADNKKLQNIYEDLGFRLIGTKQENYRKSAFYQKSI